MPFLLTIRESQAFACCRLGLDLCKHISLVRRLPRPSKPLPLCPVLGIAAYSTGVYTFWLNFRLFNADSKVSKRDAFRDVLFLDTADCIAALIRIWHFKLNPISAFHIAAPPVCSVLLGILALQDNENDIE